MAASELAIEELLAQNRRWAEDRRAEDSEYFAKLCELQNPDYLWIGCSDSRVPANQIVGQQPGEVFVHRNVGNVVGSGDSNCLSVLQYAVDVLQVEHIIVCGHYGCGGVAAAMGGQVGGALGHWLDSIVQVYELHREELDAVREPDARAKRLCELNVLEQVGNVTRTTTVRAAWRRSQRLSVHGWIYDLRDGLLRKLAEPVVSES